MRTTPLVLIDLLTEEGVTGSSYVRCYTPVALGPLVQLIANLEPLLRVMPAAPFAVERKLQRHFRLLGPQGLTGIAMAGIDMALWDARARACGVPLVTLLGGEPGPIPAYASLRTMSPAGAAAEAEELLALRLPRDQGQDRARRSGGGPGHDPRGAAAPSAPAPS